MPYKDPEKDKEYHRELMRKRREGVTVEGVTVEGVTEEERRLSKFPNQVVREETVIRDGIEMPRFVTLSDGQVMDRAYKPEVNPLPGWLITSIRASNRADSEFKPNKGNLGSIRARFGVSPDALERKTGQV